jgi:hypothetical protein
MTRQLKKIRARLNIGTGSLVSGEILGSSECMFDRVDDHFEVRSFEIVVAHKGVAFWASLEFDGDITFFPIATDLGRLSGLTISTIRLRRNDVVTISSMTLHRNALADVLFEGIATIAM